jgi:hypothetical protein
VPGSVTVIVLANLADPSISSPKRLGDGSNLSLHPDGDNDTLCATFGDSARSVGHGEAVCEARWAKSAGELPPSTTWEPRASNSDIARIKEAVGAFGVPGRVHVLGDREGFSSEESFVGFEVHRFDDAEVGGDDVACLIERVSIAKSRESCRTHQS